MFFGIVPLRRTGPTGDYRAGVKCVHPLVVRRGLNININLNELPPRQSLLSELFDGIIPTPAVKVQVVKRSVPLWESDYAWPEARPDLRQRDSALTENYGSLEKMSRWTRLSDLEFVGGS